MLTRLGWRNVGAAAGSRYPHADPARVLAERPDLVLLPDEPYPFSAQDGPEALTPVRSVPVPGRALAWYGPAMIEGRDLFEAAIRA